MLSIFEVKGGKGKNMPSPPFQHHRALVVSYPYFWGHHFAMCSPTRVTGHLHFVLNKKGKEGIYHCRFIELKHIRT